MQIPYFAKFKIIDTRKHSIFKFKNPQNYFDVFQKRLISSKILVRIFVLFKAFLGWRYSEDKEKL